MIKKLLAAMFAVALIGGNAMGVDFMETPDDYGSAKGHLGDSGTAVQAGAASGVTWYSSYTGTLGAREGRDSATSGIIVNLNTGSNANTITGIKGGNGTGGGTGTDGGDIIYWVAESDTLTGAAGTTLTIKGGDAGSRNTNLGGNGGDGILIVEGTLDSSGTIAVTYGASDQNPASDKGYGGGGVLSLMKGSKFNHTAGEINLVGGGMNVFDNVTYTAGSGVINISDGGMLKLGGKDNSDPDFGLTTVMSNGYQMLSSVKITGGDAFANGPEVGGVLVGVKVNEALGVGDISLREGTAGGMLAIGNSSSGDVTLSNNIDSKGATLMLGGNTTGGDLIMNGKLATSSGVWVVGSGPLSGDVIFTNSITAGGTGLVTQGTGISLVGDNASLDGSLAIYGGQSTVGVVGDKTKAANITIVSGKELAFDDGLLTIAEDSTFTLASGANVSNKRSGDKLIEIYDGGRLAIDTGISTGGTGGRTGWESLTRLLTDETMVGSEQAGVVELFGDGYAGVGGIDFNRLEGGTVEVNLNAGKKIGDGTFGLNAGTAKILVAGDNNTLDGNVLTQSANDNAIKIDEGVTATFTKNVAATLGGAVLAKGSTANFDGVVGVNKTLAIESGATGNFKSAVGNKITDVNVKSGGTLAAIGNTGFDSNTGGGGTGKFTIAEGATLDTSKGGIKVENYANGAAIDGVIVVGYNDTTKSANTIDLVNQTNAKVGSTASYNFSTDFGTKLKANGTADATNTIFSTDPTKNFVYNGPEKALSMLGQFGIAIDKTTGKVFVKEARNQLKGDSTAADRAMGLGNLKDIWSPYGAGAAIDQSLSDVAYDAFIPQGGTLNYTNDRFGDNAKELLDGLFNVKTDIVNEGVVKSVFRNGQVGEMLMSGFSEIRGVTSAIGARQIQLRGEAGADVVYSTYASPTLVMNNSFANRVWAGYRCGKHMPVFTLTRNRRKPGKTVWKKSSTGSTGI